MTYQDVSDLRPVPDHQEVFIDDGTVTTNSLIFELLDYDTSFQREDDTIRHYFQDLADHNEASARAVLSVGLADEPELFPLINAGNAESESAMTKICLVGVQTVAKYRSRPGAKVDKVYLLMALARLPHVGTDVLITLNVPAKNDDLSNGNSSNSSGSGGSGGSIVTDESTPEGESDFFGLGVRAMLCEEPALGDDSIPQHVRAALQTMNGVLRSIQIRDWGLFGDGS